MSRDIYSGTLLNYVHSDQKIPQTSRVAAAIGGDDLLHRGGRLHGEPPLVPTALAAGNLEAIVLRPRQRDRWLQREKGEMNINRNGFTRQTIVAIGIVLGFIGDAYSAATATIA